jgi:alcohol oxidase
MDMSTITVAVLQHETDGTGPAATNGLSELKIGLHEVVRADIPDMGFKIRPTEEEIVALGPE